MVFFFQAEDGIRDLVRSRGLGDVYKRQGVALGTVTDDGNLLAFEDREITVVLIPDLCSHCTCLLYTSDAADERSSVDLGGRRIIKKKNQTRQ